MSEITKTGAMPESEQDLVGYQAGALAGKQQEMFRLMGRLSDRQREFVRHFAAGETGHRALALAGYTGRNRKATIQRLFSDDNVQALLSLLREMDGLKYGFPAEWKRAELLDLYNAAREGEQLNTANQVLKTLLEMDGDIRQKDVGGAGAVTIKVVTGLESVLQEAEEAEVIEATPETVRWEGE